MTEAGIVSDFADVMTLLKRTLGDIEVAEEEIEKAKTEFPDKADLIHQCFLPLQRPRVLRGKDTLYWWHIRELLRRAAAGEALDEPTRAETLAVLSETSLDAPLSHDAAVVATQLWDAFSREMGVKGPEQLGIRAETPDNPETDIYVVRAAKRALRDDPSYQPRHEWQRRR